MIFFSTGSLGATGVVDPSGLIGPTGTIVTNGLHSAAGPFGPVWSAGFGCHPRYYDMYNSWHCRCDTGYSLVNTQGYCDGKQITPTRAPTIDRMWSKCNVISFIFQASYD